MNDVAVFGNEMSSVVKREAELCMIWPTKTHSLISAFAFRWLDS